MEMLELMLLIKGQDVKDYNPTKHGDWDDYFDGSGINTWWD